MRQSNQPEDDHLFVKATISTRLRIPFFISPVKAGFTSPAENYIERVCDLNDLCVSNPEATYFVRVDGDSMSGDRIEKGDVLVVDCSHEATEGKIVVVWLNGEHTVKRIHYAPPLVVLIASNPKYDPIYVQPDDNFRVFGVVTFVIFKPL
ncbi:MAG: translesion error-prone DNA polymerase V autoproteolytic subunit [Pedobacter sp.]|nr:MAG: translesion error-prone DNA polymerase V autoproteolytic subunit [Pedobacter sp.]